RLLSLNEGTETDYVDAERVRKEVQMARRMAADNNWPVIDVTRRSIEETAAAVLRLYNERKAAQDKASEAVGPSAGSPGLP
ncbi:MAG: kinase/pyrophosphorylase, partial [Novosphingobium sp.]|nr:kinase/pyrophosphorylase [Novosphingobium sp.]